MNIILLGAPASGKGTQAELLAKRFSLYLFQTGNLSRKLAEKDERIKEIVTSGKLIPEEEMTMYVLDFLHNEGKGFQNILFEGFPRFISQYEALEKFLASKGDDIDVVISIDISKEEAIKRISSRRICEKCGKIYNTVTNPAPRGKCECGGKLIQRSDDFPESVKVRFEYYEQNTKELIDYLDRNKKIIRVNGERPIETIQSDLVKIVEGKKNASS